MKNSLAIIMLSCMACKAYLTWDAPTQHTDGTEIADEISYQVEYRTVITEFVGISPVEVLGEPEYANVGTNCTYDLSGMATGVTYQVSVRACVRGNYSEASEHIVYRIQLPVVSNPSANNPLITFAATEGAMFTLYECTNLIDGVWFEVAGYGGIIGDGQTYEYEPEHDQCFFILEVVE